MNKQKNFLLALICLIGLLMPTALFAQEKPADDFTPMGQTDKKPEINKDFALGVTTWKEHGFGLLGRYRINHIAFDLAGGFNLMMAESGGGDIDVKFPYQVDAGLSVFFNDEASRFQFGMKAAGIFSQAMGFGAVLGGIGELAVGRLAFNFSIGLMYFPEYKKYMRDYMNAYSVETRTGLTEGLELYFGVSVLYYLF